MQRNALTYLNQWVKSKRRRPLVIRGARQVGKTWLARQLARETGLRLVEINLERHPEHTVHLQSKDPREVLGKLELVLGYPIVPKESLLFLDEVQTHGELLANLRWFAEELPELAVVAAGSLLEFVLADHDFSMPVGRITYLHLEPMGFVEFLLAHGQRALVKRLLSVDITDKKTDATHQSARKWFQKYMMVGGMPAVIEAHAEGADAAECRRLQRDLLATYRDDFHKYARRIDPRLLDTVLRATAAALGKKFVYAHVGQGVKGYQAKSALELLCKARLCHEVVHSDANGLPLAGQLNDRRRRVVLLDVGLYHALAGTPASTIFPEWEQLAPQVRGQLTDQIVAQQLRLLFDPAEEPRLFYWQRQGGRPGEIDYLVQHGLRIVPLELKSGASGSMKSLHQFMYDKGLEVAIRLDANPPSTQTVDVRTTQGQPVSYRLVNAPHYLAWNLPQLLGV